MITATSPLKGEGMKTHIFEVELHREEDARWSAWIEALPGCVAWGYNREEALAAIKDAAEAYVEDMLDTGEELPQEGVRVIEAPVVTITQ
jgi:antitoxin HicB